MQDQKEPVSVPEPEIITIYVCGPPDSGKTTLAMAMANFLRNQGLSIVVGLSDINPEKQVTRLRAIMDLEIPITIREACFTSDRVKEFMNREAEHGDKVAMLSRIHWGQNTKTDKIFPGRIYLVRCSEKWYTGMFRLKDDGRWVFIDMDAPSVARASFRHDLQPEGNGRGVQEVYEIVKD